MSSSSSGLISGSTNTMNSTPSFQRTVALSTASPNKSAAPRSVSEMVTVMTVASVRVMLRRKLLAVSRST